MNVVDPRKCKCQSHSKVCNTIYTGPTLLRRKRECLTCGNTWYTYEITVADFERLAAAVENRESVPEGTLSRQPNGKETPVTIEI